jgi:hypothetical protein
LHDYSAHLLRLSVLAANGGGEDLSNYRIFPVSQLLLLFLTMKTRQPVHFSSEQTLMKQSDSNLPTTGSSQFFFKKVQDYYDNEAPNTASSRIKLPFKAGHILILNQGL